MARFLELSQYFELIVTSSNIHYDFHRLVPRLDTIISTSHMRAGLKSAR